MRNQERRRYQRGLLALMAFGTFVLGLILLHGVHDLLELTSAQKPLLSDGLLKRMNSHERILNSYPHKRVANSSSASGRFLPEEDISLSRQKVVYVIVDGLRYDYLWKNPKLRALVTRPDFQVDSRAWKIYASTPTISVPNWASLVTGVPPEVHGMLANDGRKEMLFDSVMRSARRFGIPRAMAGISWLSEMYRSDLELTRGDGAVTYTALHEYELVNPDPMAAEMLLNSFDRTSQDYEPYRLFLMHFMAVDDMGHLHGVTTDYNPYNTYQKAISNTTRVLASLIDLLDNDTTLVITADHGHIDRGGHGGTHPQLYAVPLLMYRRGSGLGRSVEVNYPPAESDTSNLPEPHLPIGGPDDTEGGDLFDTDDEGSIFKRAVASHEAVEASAAELQIKPRVATANTLTSGLSAERAQSNLNVVGTVCGLLGIPAPRQSVGLVIEEAIDALVADPHQREAIYRDLFLQKKGLIYELFRALGADTDALTSSFNYTAWATAAVDDCAVAGPSGAPPESTPEARVECYKAKANHLLRAYYVHRDDALSSRITRNVLINLGFTLLLVVFAVWLVHRCSLADPRAVPVHAWRTVAPLAKRLQHLISATASRRLSWFSIEAMPLAEDAEVDQSVAASREAAVDDYRALAASFVVVSVYYPINIVALVTFCAHLGNDWDFSLWNFTQDAYLYLALVPLMSACVFAMLVYIHSLTISCRALRRFRAADCAHETAIIAAAGVISVVPRALVRRWVSAEPASATEQWPGGWRTSFASALRCSLSAPYQASLLAERYLFAHYTLLVALAGLVVIKALEGCYGVFLFPGLWRVQLLDATTWTLRFQLLGVELMQAPLFALALAQLGLVLIWPRYSSTSGLFDALFTRRSHRLRIPVALKQQQQRRKEEEEAQLGDMGLEPMSSLSSPDLSLSLSSSSSINNIEPLEEDEEEEEEHQRRNEADDDDGEGEEVAPESLDLATLLDRAAKSAVGGVASPVAFFAAQQLLAPPPPPRRGSPDEFSREE